MNIRRYFINGIPLIGLCLTRLVSASQEYSDLKSYRFPAFGPEIESDKTDSEYDGDSSDSEFILESDQMSPEDMVRKKASEIACPKYLELQAEKIRIRKQFRAGEMTLSDYRNKIKQCSGQFNIYYAGVLKQVREAQANSYEL